MGQHYNQDFERAKIIAKNITRFMNYRDVTNYWVASELGISDRQLDRYKNGTSEPKAVFLYQFCKLLGVDIYLILLSEDEIRDLEYCPCESMNVYNWEKPNVFLERR
jgi:transcriptional regulator with XRE-family HTH domain